MHCVIIASHYLYTQHTLYMQESDLQTEMGIDAGNLPATISKTANGL